MNWKALKQRKQEELPSAQLAQKKREEDHWTWLEKKADTIEKNIFKACEKQEAGSTVEYCLLDYLSFWDQLADTPIFGNTSHWTWNRGIKSVVCKVFVARLEIEGINVEKFDGEFSVRITLP